MAVAGVVVVLGGGVVVELDVDWDAVVGEQTQVVAAVVWVLF